MTLLFLFRSFVSFWRKETRHIKQKYTFHPLYTQIVQKSNLREDIICHFFSWSTDCSGLDLLPFWIKLNKFVVNRFILIRSTQSRSWGKAESDVTLEPGEIHLRYERTQNKSHIRLYLKEKIKTSLYSKRNSECQIYIKW